MKINKQLDKSLTELIASEDRRLAEVIAAQRGLNDLYIRLNYAKDFTPHKVGYYEERIKEYILTHPNLK